jgi:c-di-GMP-binding flagellar brake protein YcgR
LTFTERRKHPRVEINNLISYICIDDSDNQTKEGRGKAINISQGGILIETHDSFEWQDILLLGIDLKDESVSIKGKVIYCNADDFGKFRTGIQFLETNEKILSFVMKLLKTHSKLLGIVQPICRD